MILEGYCFRSSKFEIEPGEDAEINAGIYGRQLARWLKERLEEKGYRVEDIVDEDWGKCLMCRCDPFLLWVGCGNVTDYEVVRPGNGLPVKDEVLWHCFATAEVFFFWKRLFRRIETEPAVSLDTGTLDWRPVLGHRAFFHSAWAPLSACQAYPSEGGDASSAPPWFLEDDLESLEDWMAGVGARRCLGLGVRLAEMIGLPPGIEVPLRHPNRVRGVESTLAIIGPLQEPEALEARHLAKV